MSESENYNAFFSPDVEANETSPKQTNEYSPAAAKGKNNVYQSIIRFIPWWKDPKHGSIQDKWVCYLQDPVTNRGRYIDCPSSIGKPSPLQDIYWKLKNSESVQEQKLAATFSRRHSYASLVQVIRDDNDPTLAGKILVWRYGIKVWEKINAELKPVIGEKHDPFDILQGKAFALIITKVSGFNNYDQSKFVDKRVPLCIPKEKEGKTILMPINETSDKEQVFNWVKENSPELSKYTYREWDQDVHDYVNHVINAVTGEVIPTQKYDSIVNRESSPVVAPSEGITTTEISVENLDLDGSEESEGVNLPDLGIPDLPELGGIEGDLDDIIGKT